jgi:hypothetical protein
MDKLCECPFKEECHEPRQYVQVLSREKHKGLSVKDCPFYKYLKSR